MRSSLGIHQLLLITIVRCTISIRPPEVSTIYSWRKFVFIDLPKSENSLVNGYDYYIAQNILPSAISYHDKSGCLFLSIVRMHPGIPATIAYVNTRKYSKRSSPPLRGFPTYEDNFLPGWFGVNAHDNYQHNIYPDSKSTTNQKSRSYFHFISINYSVMDNLFNRLFLIDSGQYSLFGKKVYTRSPILWAFNINSCNEYGFGFLPALRVSIPDDLVQTLSGFATFTVDIYGNLNEFAVYIANCYDNIIIVYDNVKKTFWTFAHETFKPSAEGIFIDDPLPTNYYGFSIINANTARNSQKDVYYSPALSYGLFKTSTNILRNNSLASGDHKSSYFELIGCDGLDRQSIMVYDSVTKVIFFVHLLSNALKCWDTEAPFNMNTVVTLFTNLEFGADILIDEDRNLRFLLYNGKGMPFYETERTKNAFYQIYSVSIDTIIKDTACDLKNMKE